MKPPDHVVEAAIATANASQCGKSKRGVVLYMRNGGGILCGSGWNGPPRGAGVCAKAEVDAAFKAGRVHSAADAAVLRDVAKRGFTMANLDAVHVKTVDGQLVGGGGPSCLPCANLVLDAGISGFWLYELPPEECPDRECVGGPGCPTPTVSTWRRYAAADFYRISVEASKRPPFDRGLPVAT